jgi:hypothetical protein
MGEVVMKRNAEILEERRRVHGTRNHREKALAAGLIEAPVATEYDLGECPLSLEEIPKTVSADPCAKPPMDR